MTLLPPSVHASFGAAGPHAVTATSAGLALTYDANGNMVSKRPTEQPLLDQILAYDAENRLVDGILGTGYSNRP